MSKIDYTQTVSRSAQLLTGISAAAIGLFLIFIGLVTLHLLRADPKAGLPIVAVVLFVVGLYCLVLSFRLAFLRPRKRDGGLLSPFALRVASVCFIVVPLLLLFLMPVFHAHLILHFGFCWACGAACWRLARIRRASQRERESQLST